jgi:hypothetical protein
VAAVSLASVLGGLVWTLIQLAILVALTVWAIRLHGARPSAGRKLLVVLPAASQLFACAGFTGTVWALREAFDAVADVDPARKAVELSESISLAMTWTAAGLGLCVACLVGSVLGLGVAAYQDRQGATAA